MMDTKRDWFGIGARSAPIQIAVRIDQAAIPTTSISVPSTHRGCPGTNLGARRVIEANGGSLDRIVDGEARYWLATSQRDT